MGWVRDTPRDNPRFRIHSEAFRQAGHHKLHGALASRGDAIEERRTWPHAEDPCSVDARLLRRLRRENHVFFGGIPSGSLRIGINGLLGFSPAGLAFVEATNRNTTERERIISIPSLVHRCSDLLVKGIRARADRDTPCQRTMRSRFDTVRRSTPSSVTATVSSTRTPNLAGM